MKKRLLMLTLLIVAIACMLAISVSAEAVYVNHNGEQVEADSADIAYELEIQNPWEKGGNCRLKYIYLHDTSVKKIVIPAIELTHSNGTVYKFAEYSYVRLSTGWDGTLSVYALSDKDTKTTSLHTQITELEFHIPVLGDGAGSKGNLAGWSALEKLSFFAKAYEPQNKGGFLSGCTSLKEVHFYGKDNLLTGNFFCSSMEKVVFHEGATGTINGTAMQNLNSNSNIKSVVYIHEGMTPKDTSDPRLTWNKNTSAFSLVWLVPKTEGVYTEEQISSYTTIWQGGNNKNANNDLWEATIMTFCEFYGKHEIAEDDHMCTTGATCSKCGVSEEGKIHSVTVEWTFPDGFTAQGTKKITCNNEAGCILGTELIDKEGEYKTPALFEAIGYSTREDGTGGLSAGFKINKIELGKYQEFAPDAIVSIGLIIINTDSIGETIFTEAGVVDGKGIQIEVDTQYAIVNIAIENFSSENAQSLNLAMALYVKNDEGYTFVQAEKDSTYYQEKSVGGVDLEVVTLYNVAKKKGITNLKTINGTLEIV
ncbi:MAG: hypothetical protein IKA43_01275 [Clostridia bacterium]|nr:hypothetical protein [Clostridia bacterium]